MTNAAFITAEPREEGQTMAEYGLVLGLISVTIVVVIAALGEAFMSRLAYVVHLIGAGVP